VTSLHPEAKVSSDRMKREISNMAVSKGLILQSNEDNVMPHIRVAHVHNGLEH
jgi:hypothetical protein